MSQYPCSGCGLRFCDGRCFQGECYLESATEIDPREAQMIAEQNKRAKAFWERRNAELMALRDADASLGDPMMRKDAA